MKYLIRNTKAVWEVSHWEVESDSKEEALELFSEGDAHLIGKEIESSVQFMDSETEINAL